MIKGRVLYRDKYILAWNKLPGELVQSDRQGSRSLQQSLNSAGTPVRFPFFEAIHRLDRPTSGIVLFAKKKIAFTKISALLRRTQIEKTYWAVVENAPPESSMRLSHVLQTDHKKNKSYVQTQPNTGDAAAVLELKSVGKSERYTFLEIKLITGRQHQIRAQLAAIGCPVKGDVKYGARRGNPDRSIMLHARAIGFIHPFTQKPLSLTAAPPAGVLWDLFVNAVTGDGDA